MRIAKREPKRKLPAPPKPGEGIYTVWLVHDGSPLRRKTTNVSMAVAMGLVERWRKDLAPHSSESYSIEHTPSGRMIQF